VNRIAIACIAVIGVSATSQVAAATYYQVADSGHIISYTYDQFLTGTGGQIVGQANGYGNDAGFFYQSVMDRYFQVADSGHIISYTYDQFLTGTGGQIVGQANGYGNDAGFFFMADASDNPALVPLPASLPLLAIAIGAVAALRFRRTPARFRRPD
jgi:hypothetical protein